MADRLAEDGWHEAGYVQVQVLEELMGMMTIIFLYYFFYPYQNTPTALTGRPMLATML